LTRLINDDIIETVKAEEERTMRLSELRKMIAVTCGREFAHEYLVCDPDVLGYMRYAKMFGF
jgi:hypothetical protein